jgi:[ribosomal protein S18]-alanine N-acetyltransferase
MTDERGLSGAVPSSATFPIAAPPATGAMATGAPVATAAAGAVLEIGPVHLRDLRAVARLQRRAFRPRLAYGFLTLLLLWALPHVRFLVARHEKDGRIVGCAIGDRQDGQARVINLAVDPAARRQGIGRLLLLALEGALDRGDLLLMVEEENLPARALYEAAGYAQVGVARDYYGRGQHGLWMQKKRPGGGGGVRRKVRI